MASSNAISTIVGVRLAFNDRADMIDQLISSNSELTMDMLTAVCSDITSNADIMIMNVGKANDASIGACLRN